MEKHCQDELFKAMSNPDFYPHQVRHISQKDTHISKVFLTGDLVYKIKKPVDLGFLDFTTLAKRRHYCEREVALNRRLSDDVYLGVVFIVASDDHFYLGESVSPVECAVRMRQLPDSSSLASLLRQGSVTEEQVKELAVMLSDFYLHQERVATEQAIASWENIKYACEENFRQMQWAVGKALDRERYHAIQSATHSFLTHRKPLFDNRSESGKIYDGHGDLRCGHIYYTGENSIQIIDCLEFNRRLRLIDTAADLAFLAMDLDFMGASALGSVLIDTYARTTSDSQVYALLPFYKCYRAMVRCKVNCIKLKSDDTSKMEKVVLTRKAERYLSLAHSYVDRFDRPTIWVLCGLPASGKSSIARLLSQTLLTATLRSDVIRKKIFGISRGERAETGFGQGIYSPAAHLRTYEKLFAMARETLSCKQSIILDATFSNPQERARIIRLAGEQHCHVVFIECTAPDPVLKERLLRRENKPSVSDARLHQLDMLKQKYIPLDEVDQTKRLQVDTTQPVQECLLAIMSWDGLR